MAKKGQVFTISAIITLTLIALLVANVFIPTAKEPSTLQSDVDVVSHTYGGGDTVHTLEKAVDGLVIVDGSVSIPGLTLSSNYTVNYSSGVVAILNATASGNYSVSYQYEPANYLSSASDRSVWGVVTLAALIGVAYLAFRIFGLA